MKDSFPLFYFPPTICWIDDDQLFLDSINIKFNKKYPCQLFNNPKQALDFFMLYESPLAKITFKYDFIETDLYGVNNHFPVDIKIQNITNLSALPNKFQEIAVVVVDYNMPGINGIEICKQLESLPIKKILLTGDATYEQAVDAFNSGVIDKFIKKELNMGEVLQSSIDSLINEFFDSKTKNIIEHFETSRSTLFTDSLFIDFFKQWCLKNNIIEYYLLCKQGCFLVKDREGNLFYFIVMSDFDKEAFLSLTDELFDNDLDLLNKVKDGIKIPFFGIGKEYWHVTPPEWESHFYPAQKLSGRESYYWTVLEA